MSIERGGAPGQSGVIGSTARDFAADGVHTRRPASARAKRWAFYATNHRLGTMREHRLSGARLGPFAAHLGWTPMHGWKAEINLARLGIEVRVSPRRDDPRVQEWLAALMGRMGTNLGLADLNDGRLYLGSDRQDGPARPAESWKADDPQPPIGWHHDGQHWVQNDDGGWWRDRSGTWRYNKPGDRGWIEKPDGSWRYSHERVA